MRALVGLCAVLCYAGLWILDVSHVLMTVVGNQAYFVYRPLTPVLAEDSYHIGLLAAALGSLGLLVVALRR